MYIGVNNLCNNSNELPTPCYIFDEAEFGRGIDGFKEALLTRFADVAIGYSVKTNSLPYALRQARLHGCMATTSISWQGCVALSHAKLYTMAL